jgi:hypothetical protein
MKTRLARAALVLAAAGGYLVYVFQPSHGAFWTSGIGDWMDPYFINALLEHWYQSAISLRDPSSPPMYFPARGTLGYSHGLVLFAVFYGPVRLFLHPFLAYNVTLLLVVATGMLCLYVLLRRLGLSLAEALILTALFCTSKNVINGGTSTWAQRASVFLIPAILLILLISFRAPAGGRGLALAWAGGLLAALLYVQDFYTAHFAALLLALCGAPLAVGNKESLGRWFAFLWIGQPRGARAVLSIAILAGAWTAYLIMAGGISFEVAGVRVRSHDWLRPAIVAAVAVMGFLVFLVRRRGQSAAPMGAIASPWRIAVMRGGLVGSALFLWFYLGAYWEHRSFPEEHLLNALSARDPSRWSTPLDFIRDLGAYDTLRSFKLVFTLGVLMWLPWFKVDRKVRLYSLWFLAVSFLVLIIPLTFQGFSIWRTLIEPLPGFTAIRDPRRIIYLYELAVVFAVGLFLTRLPSQSVLRVSATLLALVLLATDWNREGFRTSRQILTFDRWVGEPIQVDASCRSFFIKAGSAEYTSRSEHMWTLYGIDAVFISLKHAIPTLNGYSAWFPEGWDLMNPPEPEYEGHVREWIARHQLRGVCVLDLDARTMRLF